MKEHMKHNKKIVFLFIGVVLFLVGFTRWPVYASEDIENRTGVQEIEGFYTEHIDSSQIYNKKASAAYLSKWESYSTYYYYNQMSSQEKKFYDGLNFMCLSYLEGTESFDIYKNNKLYAKYVAVGELTYDEAKEVLLIFIFSNPQYYFIDRHYGWGELNGVRFLALGVFEEFKDGIYRKQVTEQMAANIQEYYNQINTNASVQEKEVALHNLLVQNVTYESGEYDQSIYSVFVQKESVCAAYAKSFALLCNGLGIDCVLVTSDSHAWNKIRLNDSWYVVDSTWNDPDQGDRIRYTFFNRSQDMIEFLDMSGQHKEEVLWEDYGPKCILDSGASDNSIGVIQEPVNKTEVPTINAVYGEDYLKVDLSSPTKDAVLYYTLDGTNPTEANTKSFRYYEPFIIRKNNTLQVIAVYNSFADSDVLKYVVDVKPSNAAKPDIVTSPTSKTYTYGSKATALKVAISPVNMVNVSYQWYVKTSNNGKATSIKGATNASYIPPLTKVGTMYYFCRVTNRDDNALVTKVSDMLSGTAKIVVKQASITSCKVTKISNKTYTGKAQLQSPTITYKGKTLVKNKDYTLSYKANRVVGKAQCIIAGKGNFTGKKTYYFNINPTSTSITSSKMKSKSVRLAWIKKSQVTGYQIQYAYNSKFSTSKAVTVKGYQKQSYTLSKLKAKKICYVRIRTYKTVSGKKYYSGWSKPLKIKVK